MRHPYGPRTRAVSGPFLAAILALLPPGGSSVAVAADPSPEPSKSSVDASPIAETIHGWPGTRAAPAGLYSWPVSAGSRTWMHKVPGTTWTETVPDSVELTFYAAEPGTGVAMMSHAAGVSDDVRSEVWLFDVEGTMVIIVLDWFADTDLALVAEARAAIGSIVAEPAESGHRLVFRLTDGWDSG